MDGEHQQHPAAPRCARLIDEAIAVAEVCDLLLVAAYLEQARALVPVPLAQSGPSAATASK